MNEEPREKPIRELLEDIRSTSEPSRVAPRPLLNPKLVSRVTFFATLVCLLLTTAAFLAMIWNFLDAVLAFRCIGSMVVVLAALFIFRGINSQFD
jgi:hypothetical protein